MDLNQLDKVGQGLHLLQGMAIVYFGPWLNAIISHWSPGEQLKGRGFDSFDEEISKVNHIFTFHSIIKH